MKVLLVTLFGYSNIGNRLQNYALYKFISDQHNEVVNLQDSIPSLSQKKQIFKNKTIYFLGQLGIQKYRNFYKNKKNELIREKSIKQFSLEFISNNLDASYKDVGRIDFSDYDIGIVGSDQVWHHWYPYDENELKYFYLDFLPPEKRASYAASFGFDNFCSNDYETHKQGLCNMRFISCREKKGCDLVKSVTGRNVPHVLDPTLLLKEDEWKKIEKYTNEYSKQIVRNERYVFLYFLGEITDEYKKVIKEMCDNLGIKKTIVFNNLEDKNIALCGPTEFLYFIDNASFIFTDSFHATVFSMIFHKKFLVFRRNEEGFENMFGRIEELLKMLGCENCAYGGISNDAEVESFDVVKERSYIYLHTILN